MGFYLLDRRNPYGDHFYTSRRQPILAVVEHITAGLEDLGLVGADHSADNTARYAATTERKVSWHQGTDTDGTVTLLPDRYTAFHVAGYNSCTLGRELSKTHTDWTKVPRRWVDTTLAFAAVDDARWCRLHNIPVRKASRAELDAARSKYRTTGQVAPVGFIGHGELDPGRRTDPGFVRGKDTFPWNSYLQLVRYHLNPRTKDDDDVSKTLAFAKIEIMFREFGRDPHSKTEAPGLRYWLDRIVATDNEEGVVDECAALLWHALATALDAGK